MGKQHVGSSSERIPVPPPISRLVRNAIRKAVWQCGVDTTLRSRAGAQQLRIMHGPDLAWKWPDPPYPIEQQIIDAMRGEGPLAVPSA